MRLNREKAYDTWLEKRRKIEVPHGFSDQVMAGIGEVAKAGSGPVSAASGFVRLVSAHPLAKAAMVVAGALIGIFRILFVLLAAFEV